MKKSLKIKRIISLAAASILAFGFIMASFADDTLSPEPASDPAQDSIILSDSELEFINAASDENDRDIRTLAVDVVRATSSTYTIDDVYGLLIALITTQHNGIYEWKVYDNSIYNIINNNFSHYDSTSGNTYDTGAMLWTIRQTLNDIALELVPAAATHLPSIYELISSIDSTLTNIISAIPQPVDYTSALFFHNIGIAQMFDSFKTNNLNYLYSINNNVSSLVTNTSNIKTNTDNLVSNTNTIHNDLGNSGAIASGISSFQSDFNNINWITSQAQYLGIKSNLSDSSFLANGVYSPGTYYAVFNNYFNVFDNTIIDFAVPIGPQNGVYQNNFITSFELMYGSNPVNYKYTFYQDSRVQSHFIFANLSGYGSFNLIVKFTTDRNLQILSQTDGFVKYLSSTTYDYYTVLEFLVNNKIGNILNKFEKIYASDDILESKQNQQSYEDSGIENFTGSGSAAASVSDVVDLKDVSTTLKNGLPNSGSVNNVLNIFNGNSTIFSDIWGWFSQSNYNEINNPALQTRDSYIMDFITDNENNYQNYMRSEGDSER